MSVRRMNVCVYSGRGASAVCVNQASRTFRRLLGAQYDVMKVDAATLNQEPWEDSTALLIIPGGRDIPYMEDLPLERIRKYVQFQKGKYFGICAGGYFGASSILFDPPNDHSLKVVGGGRLGFWKGIAKGPIGDFVYGSESLCGALQVTFDSASTGAESGFVPYFGGPWFEGSNSVENRVISTYEDGRAAIVAYRHSVILCGPHLEFDASIMDLKPDIKEKLLAFKSFRIRTLLGLLRDHLQLDVADQTSQGALIGPPGDQESYPPIFMIGNFPELAQGTIIKDSVDSFVFSSNENDASTSDQWSVLLRTPSQETPTRFKHTKFLDRLSTSTFGHRLIVSDCVTSTQNLLKLNGKFTATLPSGTVFVADLQSQGKGRGKNSWISNRGCLQFTLLWRVRADTSEAMRSNCPVFAQYLAALAIAEAFPVLNIKWPNDLYGVNETGDLLKIGGILVNSLVVGSEATILIGCGLNVNNSQPTFALSQLLEESISLETVLAKILNSLESIIQEFVESKGFSENLSSRYYNKWLHSGSKVSLADGSEVRIVGLDSSGYLRACPIIGGEAISLNPDGNSFDMMRGLIKVKR